MSEHLARALEISKMVDRRANELADGMERGLIAAGFTKPAVRALMLRALGHRLLLLAIELDRAP